MRAPSPFPMPRRTQATRELSTAYPNLDKLPATTINTLGNGMRVATEPCAGNTTTVGVFVDTGSRYENEQNNGVAHFLEHMFFKGTGSRSQYQLETEIENMGGQLNAYTSREQTVFYATVFKEDTNKAVEILADILQNSNFDSDQIEREKGTILTEMSEVEGQIDEVVFDRLHETAYRGSSLGRTILGSIENIKAMNRETIMDYVNTQYTAPRMAVVGTGAIDNEQFTKAVDASFGSVPSEGKKPVVFEEAVYTGSDIRIRYDDMPLAHIAYALPIGGWTDPDTFPFLVMQSMIGNWDESLPGGEFARNSVIAKCADERMATKLQGFVTQYSDTGLFGVYAVAEPQALDDLMYNVQHMVNGFAYDVDENLLAQAKKELIIQQLGICNGSSQLCQEIGRQLLSYGRRMTPAEVVARIDAVDAAAIKAAASKYLYDQCHVLASIGPTHELKNYVQMRRETYRVEA